jgi:hypothetical protein
MVSTPSRPAGQHHFRTHFLSGFVLVLALHVVACVLANVAVAQLAVSGIVDAEREPWSIGPGMFLGLLQLVYVVPLMWLARRHGQTAFAAGVRTCAAVTFMLNAACWGLLEAVSMSDSQAP